MVVSASVASIVLAANGSDGAYFSQSWGWVALAFLVPTTVLLILDRVAVPGRLRIVFASAMGALGLWIALSATWSISSSASVREVERMLVYVALALAVALVLKRGDGPGVVAGALGGIALTSAYGLGTRLFPDWFDAYDDPINLYRLAEPLGYWNALGLLSAMGVVLAIGVVAHARRASVAGLAAAAIPVLALTLYFTFSRGAWAALALGIGAAIAADPRRLRLTWTALVVCLPSGICVLYASRHDALTTEDAPVAAAVREGHRVAVALGVVIAASIVAALGARTLAKRVTLTRRSRLVFDLALAGCAVAIVVAGIVGAGGPSGIQERFNAEPITGVDLNDRLFSVSGNGRSEQLRVAWESGREHPLAGNGAGTFEYFWYEKRPSLLIVRDGALALHGDVRGARHRRAHAARRGAARADCRRDPCATATVCRARVRRIRCLGSPRRASTGTGRWSASRRPRSWRVRWACSRRSAARAGSCSRAADWRSFGLTATLSVLAVWSLVGNQALFAGARGRRAEGLESRRAITQCARSRCSRGRTSRISCVATPLQASVIAQERFVPIEMPSRRIRATGSPGFAWPRSHAAPRVAPRTTGCVD